MQKSADLIATDLQGYKQRLSDLPATSAELANWGFRTCATFIKKAAGAQCIAIHSRADTANIYQNTW